MDYDFSGWATRNNIKCSDGRTIMKDAFKHNDGAKVPLVWNHQHNAPDEVLGHAMLENRDEGVYAYCKFNETEAGKTAKLLVQHGDIDSLSIYANQLKEKMSNVIHGNIRELSLVLAGANPGAYIDTVMAHSDDSEWEAEIYNDETIVLAHSDDKNEQSEGDKVDTEKKTNNDETVADVFNTLTEKQKTVVYAMIGQALEESSDKSKSEEDEKDEDDEGGNTMKHNVFDKDTQEDTLQHAEAMSTIISDAKRYGTMKESFLAHADEYGIQGIDWLFPEPTPMSKTPEFIKRDTDWVSTVMSGVHKTPFKRIKSMFADIREDEARAKGYIKGKRKKEEVFSLLKRTTTPTTIYKKQKMDRDDILDITDFDVISWLKSEMRMMLDEEIARAILIGDGRLASDDDKINEQNIRPIWKDEDLFTIRANVDYTGLSTISDKTKEFINTAIRSRKEYKGSGSPVLFTTEDVITECLLIEDNMGHKLYKSVGELATALRVSKIIPVEVMEGATRTSNDGKKYELLGLIVNLNDYAVGADKGGAINMFDDFDIDYNQQKYLIETRCSGALTKPFSAIALETVVTA